MTKFSTQYQHPNYKDLNPQTFNHSKTAFLMKTLLSKSGIFAMVFVIANLFFGSSVFAQNNRYWRGTTGGAWNTNTNWSTTLGGASCGCTPAAGDNVFIPVDQSAAITAVPTISLLSLTIGGTCNLQSSAGTGGSTTITTTGTFSVAAGKTFTLGLSNTGRLDFLLSSTGTGTVDGTVFMNSYNGSGFDREFQVDGTLTISSAGLLNGQNTSLFTLSAGATLKIANANGIAATGATGAITIPGTRTFAAGANYEYNGTAAQIAGTGLTQNNPAKLTINNSAGVTLSAATTISGLLTMSSGTLNCADLALTVGSLTGSGNISNSTGGTTARTITIGSDNTSPAVYSGIISNGTNTGGVSLTKTGTGTLTLSGANTYTGKTTISGGAISINTIAVIGAASSALGAPAAAPNSTIDISGTGSLIYTGAGHSSDRVINLTASGGTIKASGSGTLNLSGGVTGNTFNLILAGTGIGIESGVIGTTTGTVTKNEAGTWTLSGASTYTGLTTVSAGTLQLGAAGGATNTPLGTTAAGTSVTAGAVLDLNGFTLGTSEALTLNGTGISSGGALINGGAAATYNGAITLGSTSSIGTTGNITLGSAGVSGGQGLTKVGAGVLSLGSGTATIGALTISAGTLTSTTATLNVAGDFANSATFTHNSGAVTFNGTAQAINVGSSTFNNVTLGGSGTKTLNALTAFNNLTINTGVIANLSTFAHTATRLTLASSIGATSGTWGSTSSVPLASHTNNTFFAATTGYVTVSTDNCAGFDFAVSSVPAICEGATSFIINYTSTTGSPDRYTISGSGFTNVTDGVLSGGSITVAVPGGASAGSISFTLTVKNSIGQCVSGSISNPGVTVNVRPTPTFTASPSSPQCWNTDVTYTTQSGSGENTYMWAYPGSVLNTDYTITSGGTGASNSVVVKWLTGGSKTVTVNYNNAAGCNSLSPASSTITVNKTTATFTTAPAAGSCVGVDVTYTTQPGETNYTWSVPGTGGGADYTITGGGISSTDNTVTLHWVTTGSKVVTVSYTDANSCTSTVASSSTTVNAFPTPSFTASPGASSCTAVDITYTTQGGFTGYSWSIPGTLTTDYTITSTVPAGGTVTSSTTSVTLKWVTTGSKTVTVNYSSGACVGVSPASSNTIVGAIPAAPGAISGTATVCAGQPFTYSVTNDPTVTTYNWTLPSGSGWSGSSTTNSINTTAGTAGGVISVTATNACGTSAGIAGQTANIKPLTTVGVFNTGYTNGTTKFDGNITVSSTPNRGFIKFPLSSSLPTGTTVTASTLNLTNTGAGSTSGNTGSTITGLGNYDLVGNSASAVSTAISGGTVYSSGIAWTYPGTFGLTLNAAANTAITSLISSGNIVLGLNRTSATAFIFFGYAGGASAPNLAVTYTGPRNLVLTLGSAPATPGAITGSATVCPNTGSLTYSVTNDPTATSYTWTIPSGWSGTSTTNSITLTSGNTGDNGNITVIANNGCGSSSAQVLAVTVGSVPANPVNPTSNSPQCADVNVTLDRVTLDPSPDTWYWQGTTSLGTSTALGSGQTFSATATGTYYIRARSAAGCWSVGQGSVAVVVNSLPTAPANPSSNSPQCADLGVTLTRAASPPAGETYFWQGITAAGTSTAHSNASYSTKTDFPDGVSGTYYIRARTDLPSGCWSATSGSLAVVINPLPTGVTATPVPTAVCVGNPVSLTGTADPLPASPVNTVLINDVFNPSTFTSSNIAAPSGNRSQGFGIVTSGSTVNTYGPFSNPGGRNMMISTCGASGFGATSVNTALTSATLNTTGFTTLALTFNHTFNEANSTFANGTATVEVSTDGGTNWSAGLAPSPYATTNIGSPTGLVGASFDLSSYVGQSNLKIRFHFVSSNSLTVSSWWALDDVVLQGLKNVIPIPEFAWTADDLGNSGLSAPQQAFATGNSNLPSVTPANATLAPSSIQYTVTAKNPATGCTAASLPTTVTVNPVPVVSSPQNLTAICSGDQATLTPSGVPANTKYTWTAATGTNIIGGSANPSGVGGDDPPIAQTLSLSPASSPSAVATFTATPISGSCTGGSFTVNVTVNPLPSVANKTATICSGETFSVTPGDAPGGTTYIWGDPEILPNPGDIAGASAEFDPQGSISQALTNLGTQIQTVTYTVFPVSGDCSGAPFTVTVTVNPQPFLSSPLSNGSQCSGNFSYTPASDVENGATFSWTRAAVAGISQPAAGPTAGGINETLTNTTNVPVLVTYVYTLLSTDGCDSVQNVTVTINPSNQVASATPTDATVCPSGMTSITANGVGGTATTLTWWTGSGGTGSNLGNSNPLTGVGIGTYYARVTGTCGAPAEASAVVGITTYTITASAGAGGTISNPGPTVVNCESTPGYTITPNAGFVIDDVLVDGSSVGAVSIYNFTSVTANHTIAASFINTGSADYRSYTSGDFSDPANWEYYNGSNWVNPALTPPSSGNNVEIQATHNMVMDMNFTVGSGKTLLMDATSSLVVNPGRTLVVTGTATLNNQLVVFKSDATGTATLGNSSGSINGKDNVTIERYLPAAAVATGRSWRLLTIPVLSGSKTIRDVWAGHAANPNAPTGEVGGSGTQISGYGYADGTTAAAAGYDWWPAIANTASSIRRYTISGSNGAWTQTPLTSITLDNADQGYMLFVRGDRTITTTSGNTTLRPNGTLKSGQQTYTIPAPGTAAYKVIGNPYPATINYESLIANGVNSTLARNNRFWQWDANMGTNGGYRLINKLANSKWMRVPAPLSDPDTSRAEYIQSSQAFIIETLASGSNFTIEESNKQVPPVAPPSVFDASAAGRFYANLNIDNGSRLTLSDGVLASFDAGNSNGIDDKDVSKIDNFNENLGLIRNGKHLTLESRDLVNLKDTLYLGMSNLVAGKYALQFKGVQMQAGLKATLQDFYEEKETEISTTGDIVTVRFTVSSDAGSAAADRFRIVFKGDPGLPVVLTSAKAYQQNGGIEVEWNTGSEQGIRSYEVEKSADGSSFSKMTTVMAKGQSSNSYGWFDAAVNSGKNYYRIRIVSTDGSVSYSQVLVVNTGAGKGIFALYPNPVKGSEVTLQLGNMEKGKYALLVYNNAGQKVLTKEIVHLGGSATEDLKLGSALASGVYRVSLVSNKGTTQNQTLVVQR